MLDEVKRRPALLAAIRSAYEENDGALADAVRNGTLDSLVGEPRIASALSDDLVPDLDWEVLMTRLRRLALLEPVVVRRNLRDPLLQVLLMQCWVNEFAYWVSPEEEDRLRAQDGDRPVPADLRALFETVSLADLKTGNGAGTEFVRGLEDLDPAALREWEDSVPTLTEVRHPTSRAVQEQYDQHPYPRWHRLPRSTRPRTALPGPRVLIAGAGTGRQVVQRAVEHPDCDLLAIDLSRRALAFGKREASRLGLGRVRFAQADILELGDWERRFDLIEAIGVLHHLADPVAGLRVLAGRLGPGGRLRLGLYSRLGRQPVRAAQAAVRPLPWPSASRIRDARRYLACLRPGTPARRVLELEDYYATSPCRDLLFHVCEHSTDLLEVGGWLDACGLVFEGFESLPRRVRRAYRREFPEDPLMRRLSLWHEFESRHPDTFLGMYRFACARRP